MFFAQVIVINILKNMVPSTTVVVKGYVYDIKVLTSRKYKPSHKPWIFYQIIYSW